MLNPKFARVTLLSAVAFTLFMALSPAPPSTPMDGMGDKSEHMLAFACLAVLSRMAFPMARLLPIIASLTLFGALIEVLQAIPALQRDSDWRDWVADVVALLIALGCYEGLHRLVQSSFRPRTD